MAIRRDKVEWESPEGEGLFQSAGAWPLSSVLQREHRHIWLGDLAQLEKSASYRGARFPPAPTSAWRPTDSHEPVRELLMRSLKGQPWSVSIDL